MSFSSSFFINSRDLNIPATPTNTVGPYSRLHGKSYAQLRQQTLDSGRLFTDPDFPANSTSLGMPDRPGRYSWKRPKDINRNAKFMADGVSRFDVKQGELGDCWLAAGLVALCANRSLLEQVVPLDQSMTDGYAGIFHFYFWQYGKWVEVIIDDQLPTIYGQPAFIASTDATELWSALLEKAYAKLHGSYGALEGGHAVEAMEDFTGGVCEWFELQHKAPSDLETIIGKAVERNSLLSCAIEAKSSHQMEAELYNGLIQGHAYTVNMLKPLILTSGRRVTLVRLRNPWGNEKEWKLAWSDKSSEWSLVSPWDREQMEYSKSADGEFWMSYDDFVRQFHKLEICSLGPDALTEELADRCGKRWEMIQHDGEWMRHVSAGGCLNNWQTSFFTNPQFRVEVEAPDENDDKGTILVGLMQKQQKSIKRSSSKNIAIGFAIFKLTSDSTGPLDKSFMRYNRPQCTSEFVNLREVSNRYKLSPGHYCIIPSTFDPGLEREFILRIYSERKCESIELDEPTCMIEDMVHPESEESSDDDWEVPAAAASPADSDDSDDSSSAMPARDDSLISGISRLHSLLVNTDDDMEITGGSTEATSILADSLKRNLETARERKRVIAAFGELSDHSMEMDAYKLCDILTEAYSYDFRFNKFSVDVCRSMVAMLDDDRTGKMNFQEFKKLWRCLKKWVKIFRDNDIDKKGFVRSFHLRTILRHVGYTVSNQTFQTLVMRYGDPDGCLHFQDFLQCVVRLNNMFDVFDESGLAGTIELNLDQFIQTTMYN